MYANDDIYSGPTDPTNKINPKIVGAFYINTTTAKLFVCTNNTINNNVWKICNPDVKIPEIPPPTPMLFTTCERYTWSNGPYAINVTYTNTDSKPMMIIVAAPFYGGGSNDVGLRINGGVISEGDDWGNSVTGIIVPGATFSIYLNSGSAHYFVIK